MIITVLLLLVVAVVLIHGLISKAQSEQNARDELANCCQVDPSGRTPYQLANGETPHP